MQPPSRQGREQDSLDEYDASLRDSWIAKELKLVQNAEPLTAKFSGDLFGSALANVDMWLRYLKLPAFPVMKHHTDASATKRADLFQADRLPQA